MNKDTAIKEVYRKRKEQSEEDFQADIEQLVCDIEATSDKLRELKTRLTELTYKEPENQGGIFTPEIPTPEILTPEIEKDF
ncbi:unnamed protein product [marine sediment metagenome]|uniref:Uncharacterized protein n=1 Tax=marine sediment metagenome TaxID=412755 RepID=X0YNJ3_9ZZZZ